PSHFFRFWLWLTTGMVTKDWVAIHRKHHAKCETVDDPHSPQIRGLSTVLLTGSELYREAAAAMPVRLYLSRSVTQGEGQTELEHYGHGTPDDWLERKLYSRHIYVGVGIMLITDLVLFGAIGLTVWAVQMLWIPVTAAGIINGLGHYWGYRNFETPAPDTSTNISPWGIIIGGEELHNNHHTYPTSAKLSVRPWEFDIGWVYIRGLELLGLAMVQRTRLPPQLEFGVSKSQADAETLRVVAAKRYELMAQYAQLIREELAKVLGELKATGKLSHKMACHFAEAKKWLVRDPERVPHEIDTTLLSVVREHSASIVKLMSMREKLRLLWTLKDKPMEYLVAELRSWCQQAEASNIPALGEFSRRLRSVR
ncbi:MAG: acyl-CoA desaturase, partial [Candidatus Moraniibacteriota bacterium]